MFQGIRDFIDAVERIGELKKVIGADPNIEMGSITEVAASSPGCPMLLFDQIKGYSPGFRVTSNLLHTPKRLALALDLPLDLNGIPFVVAWKDKVSFDKGQDPVVVKDAFFHDNVFTGKDVNIRALPSPKWHEKDGGEYFGTAAITVARDPDSGYVNCGIYRLQSWNENTLLIQAQASNNLSVIQRKYWARGESCPVVVCTGVEPVLWISSTFYSVPFGLSEYKVAAHLRGAPVEVVNGELSGLPVPAAAEIALEGEIPPPEIESHPEGPLGEFTGYYSGHAQQAPVIRIKRLMYRDNPIMHAGPPMKPLPGLYWGGINWRAALIWRDLERSGMTGIRGVWQHGASLTIISLSQQYPGHAMQVGLAASISRNADIVRFIILVDDDVDPSNIAEVFWAMSTRCEPEEINIVKGSYCGIFDPRIPPQRREQGDLTGARAIIDACRPYHWREKFPIVNEVSPEQKAQTIKKWGKVLGL